MRRRASGAGEKLGGTEISRGRGKANGLTGD